MTNRDPVKPCEDPSTDFGRECGSDLFEHKGRALAPESANAKLRAQSAAIERPTCESDGVIAWEATTIYYRQFVTDKTYRGFSDEVRKWYKPYRCSRCDIGTDQNGDRMEHDSQSAEIEQLRSALRTLHRQSTMLRGAQSYREFGRFVERKTRAALGEAIRP